MLDKAYVEITNICNLHCSFCAGHNRKLAFMSPDKFSCVLNKLEGQVRYLYLHLMGEPLSHPNLSEIMKIADRHSFRVILTTNGTMLSKNEICDVLLSSESIYKISISLHSFEDGEKYPFTLDDYLNSVFAFGKKSADKGIITVYRLWRSRDDGGENDTIADKMKIAYPENWEYQRSGKRLCANTFLEYGDKFIWPETGNEKTNERFCFALRDQIGILADGTVVPCCLDHNGSLALGNIFMQNLGDILSCERAKRIYNGFSENKALEECCKSCRPALRR